MKRIRWLASVVALSVMCALVAVGGAPPKSVGAASGTVDVSPAKNITNTGDASGKGYYERDPQLLMASSGSWYLIYSRSQEEFDAGGNPDDLKYDIYYQTSTDDGATWSVASKVLNAAAIGSNANFRSATITEADGKIWVIGANIENLEGDIYASTYSGGSWSSQSMIFDGTYSTGAFHLDSVAEGDDIRLFYGIEKESNGVGFIKYDGSIDTWDSSVTQIGATAGYQIPRVIKDGSTYHLVSTNWSKILYTSTNTPDITPWPSATSIASAPSGGGSSDPSIVKYGSSGGSADLLVFNSPWYSDESQPVEYVYSDNGGSSWSSPSIAFTDAAHGSQKSWDMMSRAYVKDADTVMVFFGMEQRGVNRGQGDIVISEWDISSTIGNAHYTTIQDGVDNATSGDTIDVADGIYTATSLASVVIAKDGLSLVGESRDGTIIDGGTWGTSSAGWPKGIHVYANDVTIRNLTVRGFTGDTVNTGGYGIVFRDWAHDMPAEGYIFYSGSLVENVRLENNYSPMYSLVHRNLTIRDSLIQNNLSDGMFIARESDNATITGNTVINSGDNGIWVGTCWMGLGPSGNATITGNVVDGAREGGISFVASDTALISENDVSHVKAEEPEVVGGWSRGAISLKDGVSNVTVSNNVVHDNDGLGTGSGRGIGVDGTSSNITLTGNIIRDNADGGIKVMGTTTGWVASYNSIHGNTGYGAQNTTGSLLDFTGNWWGSANGPTHASNTFNVGAQGDAVSDNVRFVPWLDAPGGASFAPVTTTNLFGSYASIQAGVNASNPGGTVNAASGTFTENVTIAKGVTVAGAGEGATIVIPAVSKPNPCAGSSLCGSANAASNLFLVQASGVTIHDLTVDGDNPTLTSGIVRGGADLDARNGIVENYYAGVYNNLQLHDVTVKNIYLRGIYASSGGTGFDFHDNTVQNVQGESQSIGIFNFGGSGAISDNSVSDCNDAIAANWSKGTQFLGNTVTSSGSAIHSDNNGGTGGVGDLIQGNTVTNSTPDGYGIWTFVPYVPITVQNNTISGVDVGLAASGQAVPVSTSFVNNQVTGKPGSIGVYVTTDEFGWGSGNVSASFTGNTITGHADGFVIEAQAGYTATVNATGNSIFGNSVSGAATTGDGTHSATMEDNWWGSANGPTHASNTFNVGFQGDAVSDSVDFVPWLNAAPPGGASFAPVTTTNPVGSYASVQAGINASNPTGTVNAKAGTYDEQVVIGKRLTVDGAGQGVTVIAPSPIAVNTTRVGGSSPGSAVAGIVVVDSTTGVTIRDLTVDGAGNALTACDPPEVFGVYWRNASGTIENSEVRNIEFGSGLEGCQGATGIFAESGGTGSTTVTIDGNSVHDVQKNGITANGSATYATISGNIVVGWGFTDKIAQNGIQIGFGAGGSITGNEASLYDYDYTLSSWWAATGILVTQAADGVVISGNNVHDNLEGIYADTLRNLTVSGNTVTNTRDTGVYLLLVDNSEVSGNSISSGSVGLWLADSSSIAAKLNTISYNGDGVVIDGESQNDTFTDNKILNNTSTGVTVQPYYGVEPSGLVFRLNQIAGNGTYGIDNTTGNVVDALSNWWGHATGPKHPTLNPTGQGNKVSDRVLFDPWVKAIEYVGDTSIPSGSTANLRARFLNSSGTTPLVAGVTVHFDLLDSLATPVPGSPFSALTDGSGVASVPVTGLGIGLYTVTARWDPLEDSTNLTVSGTGDSDGDGVPDTLDNCPAVYNPDQKNSDGGRRPNGSQIPGAWASNPAQDKLGDACDPDDDNDALPDTSENELVCPFRLVGNSDVDRVLDGFEVATGYNPCSDDSKPRWEGGGDSDGDGFPDGVERTGYNTCIFASDSFPGYTACINPADSDGDGCADWIEINDLDGNRTVDSGDSLYVAQRFANRIPADLVSDPIFDVDKNGKIDSGDMLAVAKNNCMLRRNEGGCPRCPAE